MWDLSDSGDEAKGKEGAAEAYLGTAEWTLTPIFQL